MEIGNRVEVNTRMSLRYCLPYLFDISGMRATIYINPVLCANSIFAVSLVEAFAATSRLRLVRFSSSGIVLVATNEKMANLIKSDSDKTILLPAKPSSPRQFFERIYGHLETNSSVKTVHSPIQSEQSSSPIYLDDR